MPNEQLALKTIPVLINLENNIPGKLHITTATQVMVLGIRPIKSVERDGRSMRSCRCGKWIYKENSSPIVL